MRRQSWTQESQRFAEQKEIAEIQKVSVATVHRHREYIRRQLKIINHEVNLATYLQVNMGCQEE